MASWQTEICLKKTQHEHKYSATFVTKVGSINWESKLNNQIYLVPNKEARVNE